MPKRLLQFLLIGLVGLTMLGASSPERRYEKLGHNLMCTCSCGEVLLECNHVGCPTSGPMTSELHMLLASAVPDPGILHWFVTKYGPIVLASPTGKGFDLVAWIVPFAVLGLGIAGVIFLVRLWHRRHAQLAGGPLGSLPVAPALSHSLRDRIRRDTTFEP